MIQPHRIAAMLLVVVLVLQTVGCGSPSGPALGKVSGLVQVNGSPTEGLSVFFESESGATATGVTDKDGKYRLSFPGGRQGSEIGTHTVRITGRDARVSDSELSSLAGEIGTTLQELKKVPVIPTKYNEKSELSAEVKSGANELNFELNL